MDDLEKYWEEKFLTMLILLSSDAEKQIEYGGGYIDVADELAEDLSDAYRAVKDYSFFGKSEYLSAKDNLEELDRLLDDKSGMQNSDFWSNGSLKIDPLWQKIREMAFKILKKIGKDNYDVKIISIGNMDTGTTTKTELILKSE